MGVTISKLYSYKSQSNVFKLLLNFPPNGPHKTRFGYFKSNFPIFNDCFFETYKFTIVAYGENVNLNYLENERS